VSPPERSNGGMLHLDRRHNLGVGASLVRAELVPSVEMFDAAVYAPQSSLRWNAISTRETAGGRTPVVPEIASAWRREVCPLGSPNVGKTSRQDARSAAADTASRLRYVPIAVAL
jgi:hypothetical protein